MSRQRELTVDHTAYVDKPTVRQLKIAFEETPVKLREIEHGWRGRRKEQMTAHQVDDPRGCSRRSASRSTVQPGPSQGIRVFPPTPPDTPEEQRPVRKKTKAVAAPTIAMVPMPILSFPLVHTPRSMRIAPGVHLTIPLPTPHAHELEFDVNGQAITVLRGGRSLVLSQTGPDHDKKHRLDLDAHGRCSPADLAQWTLVTELVEKVKRRTPRVSRDPAVICGRWMTDVASGQDLSSSRCHHRYLLIASGHHYALPHSSRLDRGSWRCCQPARSSSVPQCPPHLFTLDGLHGDRHRLSLDSPGRRLPHAPHCYSRSFSFISPSVPGRIESRSHHARKSRTRLSYRSRLVALGDRGSRPLLGGSERVGTLHTYRLAFSGRSELKR